MEVGRNVILLGLAYSDKTFWFDDNDLNFPNILHICWWEILETEEGCSVDQESRCSGKGMSFLWVRLANRRLYSF